jgi:nicotinamide mononucleotide transporter
VNLSEWTRLFAQQIAATTLIEWVAVATAVAEVLLARANNILLYPAGIASTLIYTYLLAVSGLYADSALNVYYLVMSAYGWLHWAKRGRSPVAIAFANRREWAATLAIAGGAFAVLYFILNRYTDSTVPLWDAWVSATAWAGMWLLARRKVENWLVLNVSNLFAIPLFVYKHLPLTACLTLFLFIVAVFGYFDWRKISAMKSREN